MMDEQQRLTEAARSGDIKLLHETISRNPDVLRRIDETPFLDTPLHVSASEGQVPFAAEMMRLMPSYARKSNADGFSPVHAAAVSGQTKAATQLTKRDADLIRHSGLEGFTPLHCAARTGNVELLGTFLAASPESMEDVTVRGETALMVALKNIVCFEDDDGQIVGQRYRSRPSYKPQVSNAIFRGGGREKLPLELTPTPSIGSHFLAMERRFHSHFVDPVVVVTAFI